MKVRSFMALKGKYERISRFDKMQSIARSKWFDVKPWGENQKWSSKGEGYFTCILY